MSTIVICTHNVLGASEWGGHTWVYLQYIESLRRLGCDIYWMEDFDSETESQKDANSLRRLAGKLDSFGLAEKLIIFRRVEQLRQIMVDHGDAARQIWLTEWGWTADTVHPAYAWFAVSEDKKASNLIAAFQYARDHWAEWIGVMTVWTLADPTWDKTREEYWWAIANPDGSPREAYNVIRKNRLSGLLP